LLILDVVRERKLLFWLKKAFLDKYKGNKSAEEFIKYEKHHALLYEKYKDYYGYVFYIGKKI